MSLLIFALCFIQFAPAQTDSTVFQDVTDTHLPVSSNLGIASTVGDIDRDGDLDIILGVSPFGPGWSGQTRLYINDGNGYFTEESNSRLPLDTEDANDVILGDIDADGDLDLFISNIPQGTFGMGQDNLYLNSGDAHFIDVSIRLPQEEVHSASASFVDVNGDNTLDLVVAHIPPQLLLNDGTGNFTDYSTSHLPTGVDTLNIYKFLPADIDGDWDLDLIVVNAWNPNSFFDQHEEIWINEGNGTFTRRVDLLQSATGNPGLDGDVYDLNGDGILDIIIAQVFENELYLSSGSGSYQNVSLTHLPPNFRTAAIQLGDVNGNGLIDIVLANSTYDDQLFINTGNGIFTDSSAQYLSEIPQSSSRDVNLFDADNDGDLDLHFASTGDGQNRLLFNTGPAQDITPPVLRHDEEAATWQDTTGRGHLRVFASDASRWIERVILYRHTVEGDIDTITTRTVGGDLYQATVDSQTAATTWEYYWLAEDRVGNQSRLPESEGETLTWVPRPVNRIGYEPINKYKLEVLAYPNPFNSQLRVRVELPREMQLSTLTFTLTNLLGQVVASRKVDLSQETTFTLNWDPIQTASGVYFLTVSGQGSARFVYHVTKKVVLLK